MRFCCPPKRPHALLLILLAGSLVAGAPEVRAADHDFPFDRELLLDVLPMRGSKRLPALEIDDRGRTVIDLWCNSVEGQIVVVEDTITIMTGNRTERACPPERQQGDEELHAALRQVTHWRRDGVTVTLIGPKRLRYRIPTN